MPSTSLRENLASRRALFGLCQMYPAPGIIEGMCAGWDLVWIDGQHGQIDENMALQSIRTARSMGIYSLLRARGDEPSTLGALADLAPSALMIPMVNTAAQAEAIVRATHFAPRGMRSYGGRRPIDLLGRGYHQTQQLVVVAQIETIPAVENAGAIINTDGIDMLFFGGDDMKIAMGIPIDTPLHEDKRLIDAMNRTARAARAAGKWCACVATSPAAVRSALEMEYQLIIAGSDAGFIRRGAADQLSQLRSLDITDTDQNHQTY